MSHDTYKPTPEQTETVLAFAIHHNCVINPDGWRSYLESYTRKGHCPCDKERMECPCKQAPQEIKQKARCLCGLFWSSYEAYSIAKSLRGAAVGIRVQPDKEEVEKQPNETEEPKTRHEKIEALFDFGERDKTTPPTLQRFVESAASILSIGTGIALDPGQRMIISRNEDGSLSLDVSFNLKELGGKDIRG
jgi:ferredoxin-thioredoxin reductase catalytic subunit